VRQRRSPRPSGFSAWFRAIAALAALLIAGDHGLASLHQALTAHEVCAEHGELVHAESVRASFVARTSVPAVDAADQVEAAHHHCGAVPAAPTRAPLVHDSIATLDSAFGQPEPTIVVSIAVPPADVVAFAPKQSPPA
jgi:hypothetical protein